MGWCTLVQLWVVMESEKLALFEHDDVALSSFTTKWCDYSTYTLCYLVEFLVVGHSQLDVPGSYSAFLVVPCCVSCQLQDLSLEERKTQHEAHQTYNMCSGIYTHSLSTVGPHSPSEIRIQQSRHLDQHLLRNVDCCSGDVDIQTDNKQKN